MEDNKVHFLVVANKDDTHKGYSLATLAQAQENNESVTQTYRSSPAFKSDESVRLKNGTLERTGITPLSRYHLASFTYERCEWKLLTNSKSGKEVPKEDCLIALGYAAEYDDVEAVEELVQYAGPKILKTRMPFAVSGTVLHVCTDWNSMKTLRKVLNIGHPENVDVSLVDRNGDTALHNLASSRPVSRSEEDCYQAACLLLGVLHTVDAANDLLGIRNNYGQMTALCQALLDKKSHVGAALLEAAKIKMEEIECQTSIMPSASRAPQWLTLRNHNHTIAALDDEDNDEDPVDDVFCTALHLAVWRSYDDVVTKILAYPGAKALNLTSLPDHKGNTPLHTAAKRGDSGICLMLLQHGAETNSKNGAGATPLHIAATRGHAETCEMLLEHGASLSVRDKHGKFALMNAYTKSHKEVVEVLLDAYLSNSPAKPAPDTPAESAEHSRIHAKAKGSLSINEQLEFGLTPLHVAIAMKCSEYITKLLEAGAMVELRTSDDGWTPLHISAQVYDDDDGEALVRLLDGAKKERNSMPQGIAHWINMRGTRGQTALHNLVGRLSTKGKRSKKRVTADEESSESNSDREGGIIVNIKGGRQGERSTDDKIREKEPSTETEELSNETRVQLGRGLVSADEESCEGSDDKIREEEPTTETEELSNETRVVELCREMVSLLLEKGARVDEEDSNGETPLHLAARHQYKVLDTLLLEAKHPHNFRSGKEREVDNDRDRWICKCDFAGQTALHEAARAGCVDCVVLLLEKTNSPNDLLRVRDMENMTAMDWAAQNRNAKEMIEKMMRTTGIDEITKGFLMWSLKDHVQPHVFEGYCQKYKTEESDPVMLLQAAVESEDVDIAREIVNSGTDVTALDNDAQSWLAQNLGKASCDQPTLKDTLGRGNLVQGVATLLVNPYTETPVTIGVFGSWGAGKSSFMLQVEEAMLSMVVKETFRSTTYSPSLNKAQSMTKLSRRGCLQRSMVVNALKDCMAKTTKLKHVALGQYLRKDAIIENFSMELQSTNRPLFRSLALFDRSKLVQSPKQAWYKRRVPDNAHFIAYTPAVLTLHYNAWQYDNKNEASAGLAIEISKQLESFMTPQQWLRMCWKYSWKSRSRDIIAHLIFPILLGIIAAFIALVLWKFVPIATRYKVLSLPVGILVVTGAIFKTCLEAIQPVTWTMLNLTKSFDHKSMLGYQHQVIDNIKFLKDQLCKDAHFGWIIVSLISQLFISNTYFVEGTWVWRQYPSLNNFRIVVFIDDLDRCDEKSILELLRAINLILGSCGINVVIGVDKDMLQRAIIKDFLKESSDKYFDIWLDEKVSYKEENSQTLHNADGQATPDKKHTQKMARSEENFKGERYSYTIEFADMYMQKIIQLPIHMPDPSKKLLKQFLNAQVGKRFTRLKNKKDNKMKNDEESESQKPIEVVVGKNNVKDKENSQTQHGSENGTSEGKSNVKDKENSQTQHGFEDGPSEGKNNVKEKENSQTQHGLVDGANVFHLLLANYTPMEKDMLNDLCQFTTQERRIPREWKRFLNYHRLAWTILSQDDKMKSKEFKGWQRKLILWIFVCWNWRPQMNAIFQNWHKITSKNSKWQARLLLDDTTKNDPMNVELRDIIKTYFEIMKLKTKVDNDKSMQKEEEEMASIEWTKLEDVLQRNYDIPMHFVEKFQQFRFYCILNHLEIGENF